MHNGTQDSTVYAWCAPPGSGISIGPGSVLRPDLDDLVVEREATGALTHGVPLLRRRVPMADADPLARLHAVVGHADTLGARPRPTGPAGSPGVAPASRR